MEKNIYRILHLTIKFTFLFFCIQPLFGQEVQTDSISWQTKEIAEGLLWKQTQTRLFNGAQSINILEVNLKKRAVTLACDEEEKQLTSKFGNSSGSLAAVNAGFFDVKNGGSVTYIKVDGKLPSSDTTKWKITKTLNGAFIIKNNGKFEIEKAGSYSGYTTQKKFDDVLVTGCLLIDEGREVVLPEVSFVTKRHPRTCLGIINKNTVLLVTVDGRSAQAEGMTLYELTKLMQSLNCKEAINLDGGGSTTMWINASTSGVVNYPSDNKKFDHQGERTVANALVVK